MKTSPWSQLTTTERARIEEELARQTYRAQLSKRILLIIALAAVLFFMLTTAFTSH